MRIIKLFVGCGLAGLFAFAGLEAIGDENFREYVRTSKDFKSIPQKKEVLLSGRWDHWIMMPWRYQWARNYDDACAAEMKEWGHNGAFCDAMPGGDAAIHEKYGFLWYNDHTAGKGDLYLQKPKKEERIAPNRPVCLLDPAAIARMKERIDKRAGKAKTFKNLVAYALDDEISWSTFTSPCKWDNSPLSRADFARWLKERYKSEAALKKQWGDAAGNTVAWGAWPKDGEPPPDYIKRMINPDDLQAQYPKPFDQWNLSPWCDALAYMDSQFNNLVGDLVEYANSIDPETPCGFVGGQAPATYGGYDYAKMMRKIQFLEAYDIGANMEIARSLNPDNMIPTVKTGWGDPAEPTGVWFNWYYLVHGDRGVIAWAEGWFGNKLPAERIKNMGEAVRRIAKYSKVLYASKWVHDGVALYYSQPSIQMSWFIDSQPHGKTWINRLSSMDNNLSSSGGSAWSWQKLLEDYKIQYNWVTYAQLLDKGLDPAVYKALILPRTLALSDQEAEEIRKYVAAGGCVIADHQTGLFDQHGKARPGGKGALDDLFGISNRPVCKPATTFAGGGIYAESNHDKYYKHNFIAAAAPEWPKCLRDTNGFIKAQRDLDTFQMKKTGKGWACHLNISLFEYCAVRGADYAKCGPYAKPITDLLNKAGVKPWVALRVDGREPHIAEVVYWTKAGRLIVCVVKNPMKFASVERETKTEGVEKKTVKLTVSFVQAKSDGKDEIAGTDLGSGNSFTVDWKTDEAAILSFKM